MFVHFIVMFYFLEFYVNENKFGTLLALYITINKLDEKHNEKGFIKRNSCSNTSVC